MSDQFQRKETVSCVEEVVLWENVAQMGAHMKGGHLRASTGLPRKGNMIDAVYWAEMMYQGVHEEQENYAEFSRQPKELRERKHDRVRSDLEKWEDPWLWVFRLHEDCEWWNTCSVVSESMGNDLENPRPGKRHKYV